MACLLRLFQTRSGVPNQENPKTADNILFGIILGDFLFHIDNGILIMPR